MLCVRVVHCEHCTTAYPIWVTQKLYTCSPAPHACLLPETIQRGTGYALNQHVNTSRSATWCVLSYRPRIDQHVGQEACRRMGEQHIPQNQSTYVWFCCFCLVRSQPADGKQVADKGEQSSSTTVRQQMLQGPGSYEYSNLPQTQILTRFIARCASEASADASPQLADAMLSASV